MKYVIRTRFNPYHHPAGAPGGIGGQFASKPTTTPGVKPPPGSFPVQSIDFTELFKTLPKPRFKPHPDTTLHQWHDVLDDAMWEPYHDFKQPRVRCGPYKLTIRFNPNHVPGGRPDGGQFASANGAYWDSMFGMGHPCCAIAQIDGRT